MKITDQTTGRLGAVALMLSVLLFIAGCGGKNGGGHRSVIIPSADGTKILTAQDLVLDISHLDLGYFMVQYQGEADKIYLQLTGEDQTDYKYFIEPSENYVTIPLTVGDGTYYTCVYESVGNNQYSPIWADQLDVELSDKFGPFLCSSQYVNFTMDSRTAELSAEVTADAKDDLEKVTCIYSWVVQNITYDYEKAITVESGYLPDDDRTIRSGKGICFDYAALMTAMARIQGIPAKLNIGYLSGSVYHAWISIYLDGTGWIDGMIRYDGNDWEMMDPTVASESGAGEAEKIALEDDSYIVRYVR